MTGEWGYFGTLGTFVKLHGRFCNDTILIRVQTSDIIVGINVCFICVTLHYNSRFRIISCVIFSLFFKLVIFFGTLRLLPTKLFPLLLYTTPSRNEKNMGFNLLLFCEQFRVSYYRGLSCSRKVHLGPKSSLGD